CAGFAVSTAYGEAPTVQTKETDRSTTSNTFGTNQIASAQGGVHLLEHILSRMRNLPQLAISKTKQTIAMQSQAMVNEPSQAQATNVNLLIKPKGLPRAQLAQTETEARLIASSKVNHGKFIGQTDGFYGHGPELQQDAKDFRSPAGVWE